MASSHDQSSMEVFSRRIVGCALCGFFAGAGRRRRVPEMARRSLARGAAARRHARDFRSGHAQSGARSHAARSRNSRPAQAAAASRSSCARRANISPRSSFTRLAEQGKKLAAEHRATLARIEREFGVPGNVILAIWGRETAYGTYKLPHNAIRVLATQAYAGRRKEQFREEFLLALKMLQQGHVKLADMKSSWAGAMGHTQFLPTDFYKYAVDFDGDGKRDIWNSVPDALASAAKQLVAKGWQPGRRWAYEARAPGNVDCTIAEPGFVLPVGEWIKRGYAPAYGRTSQRRRARRAGFAAACLPGSMVPRSSRRKTTTCSRTTISPISTSCSSGT